MTENEITKMKVKDLREALAGRGLPTNGLKTELVERLVASCATAGD